MDGSSERCKEVPKYVKFNISRCYLLLIIILLIGDVFLVYMMSSNAQIERLP
jgi:hypothetical protein